MPLLQIANSSSSSNSCTSNNKCLTRASRRASCSKTFSIARATKTSAVVKSATFKRSTLNKTTSDFIQKSASNINKKLDNNNKTNQNNTNNDDNNKRKSSPLSSISSPLASLSSCNNDDTEDDCTLSLSSISKSSLLSDDSQCLSSSSTSTSSLSLSSNKSQHSKQDAIATATSTTLQDATHNVKLSKQVKLSTPSNKRNKSKNRSGHQHRRNHHHRRKETQLVFRRPSCCKCTPIVTCIDESDGLQVTDVDLVSSRDLDCIEASSRRLLRAQGTINSSAFARRSSLQSSASISSGDVPTLTPSKSATSSSFFATLSAAVAAASNTNDTSHVFSRKFNSNINELAAIRRKYTWFPPTLTSLALVDEFFSRFAAGKVPLRIAARSPLQQQQQQLQDSSQKYSSSLLERQQAAHRDEQIAQQLPRQDFALDYCSYPLSESARLAYQEFVDRRNAQALDVARVVQIRFSFASTNGAQSNDKLTFNTSYSNNSQQQQQQAATTTTTITTTTTAALNSVIGCPQLKTTRALKCRRCLVRFEDKQLAVVAPNFVIASGPAYRPAAFQRVHSPDGKASSVTATLASDATLNSALFHPTCFSCATCKEFLVDLTYCLRDNKLLCVRHYGDSIRQRCSWCQELIFSDEYLSAVNNNSFHTDHFLCRHCDKSLANKQFVVVQCDKQLCIECYEQHFANVCEQCKQPIGVNARNLAFKDKHWHENCFLCNKCSAQLKNKPFGSNQDKVYCADCYDQSFSTRCDSCNQPFRPGSKKMEYRGRQWHDMCFCCCICKNAIGANSFIPKADDIYCIQCYQDKFATRCVKCCRVIVSGGVTFRNQPWHRHCFNCANCNKSLAGQRFTTREVTTTTRTITSTNIKNKRIVKKKKKKKKNVIQETELNFKLKPTNTDANNNETEIDIETENECNTNTALNNNNNKITDKEQTMIVEGQQIDENNETNEEEEAEEEEDDDDDDIDSVEEPKHAHNAYCIDCYSLLFAKKCHACSLAITGAGGAPFVTFEHLSWHSKCFACDECKASLVGRGFITDGPDSILCGDCARAKLG